MGEIIVRRYSPDQKDIWNDFVRRAKNALFLYNRGYMDYHADRFLDHSLIFEKESVIVALMPANENGKIIYSHEGLTHGGLLLDCSAKQHTVNECFDIMVKYYREQGFEKMFYKPVPHIYHLQPSEEDLYSLYSYNATLAEITASTTIDLENPLKMPKGRKAQIKRAVREGVIVSKLSQKEDYVKFFELEKEVLEKRHGKRPVHSADEMYMLHERFPDQIVLYGAKHENRLVAGSLVFCYESAIHTQYMASDEVARKIGALDLVINTVIEEYCGKKKWLDFGISTENCGKYLNEGLISQKESFGGRTNIYELWQLNLNEGF